MAVFWYAIRSKPNKEDFLARQFEAADVPVFYPCLRVSPVNPRSRKTKPYFPGYLFIQVDWILSTLRLFSGCLARLPSSVSAGSLRPFPSI